MRIFFHLEEGKLHSTSLIVVGCSATICVQTLRCNSPFLPLGSRWHKGLPGSGSDGYWSSEPQVWSDYQKSSTQVRQWYNNLWRLRLEKNSTSSLVGSWLSAVTVNPAVFRCRWPLLNLQSKWIPPLCLQWSSLMASMVLSWGSLQVGNLIPLQN